MFFTILNKVFPLAFSFCCEPCTLSSQTYHGVRGRDRCKTSNQIVSVITDFGRFFGAQKQDAAIIDNERGTNLT